MKEKFVLCPGKICTLDKDNTLKQDEHGTIFVEIVREVPRKKIFGPRLFEIIGAGDDKVKMLNPIIVPETLLSPEGMSVIRYPSDNPVVNNSDVWALGIAINFITDPKNNFIDNSDKDRSVVHRLKALMEKLKYYTSSNEV